MKTDFLGKEINIGDTVVFIQLGYRKLLKGKIKSISNKMCLIEHEPTNIGQTETKQFHNQIVKV